MIHDVKDRAKYQSGANMASQTAGPVAPPAIRNAIGDREDTSTAPRGAVRGPGST